MTPQHSSLPGQAFRYGMTTQTYMRIKCHFVHIYALYKSLSNVTLGSTIPTLSVALRLVRYCFHCFQERFIYLGQHLAWVFILCRWQQLAQANARHLLDPPGGPPWCKFTNYLKTKNRPFYNPCPRAIPKAWRSSERRNFLNHFLSLRTSSRTELAHARMRGPETNNNSTKNKG